MPLSILKQRAGEFFATLSVPAAAVSISFIETVNLLIRLGQLVSVAAGVVFIAYQIKKSRLEIARLKKEFPPSAGPA